MVMNTFLKKKRFNYKISIFHGGVYNLKNLNKQINATFFCA